MAPMPTRSSRLQRSFTALACVVLLATAEPNLAVADPNERVTADMAAGWTTGPSMLELRYAPSAAVLTDGRVLVGGKRDPFCVVHTCSPPGSSTAEIYDPATNSWAQVSPMPHGGVIHALSGGDA